MSSRDASSDPPRSMPCVCAPRIIVVDDDTTVLRALVRMLRAAHPDWEIAPFRDAEEALATAASRRFDLIIADLDMPGMSGIELLERCRRDHPEMIRMVHSAQVETKAGFTPQRLAFVTLHKPVSSRLLIATVEHAVTAARGGQSRAGNGDY